MNNKIILFSGKIGSGKSTLSLEVSKKLKWPVASFGNFIRKYALLNEYDTSRKSLQYIGNYLISRGWTKFCKEVLNDSDWDGSSNLIVDGIRHIEAIDTISKIVKPAKVYLIYISTKNNIRKKRLQIRNENDGTLIDVETHSTEIQVKKILYKRADFIIHNNEPIDAAVKNILKWVNQLNMD